MIEQARTARDHGKGLRVARQHLYAAYDLALHSDDAREPLGLWTAMEGSTPLGHVPGTLFPAAFGHIAGSYAAGYYGYLWANVVALDLRTAFTAGRLDPATGTRYRQSVLSQGRQRPPDALVADFLGRPTDSVAFFADLAR
jgi:thimet oligopeptidase